MVECKHNLKEISRGFNYENGYSPTILRCIACGKHFMVCCGYDDRIEEIKVR